MRTETVVIMSDGEFDKLVKDNFPNAKGYEFAAFEEVPNDSDRLYTIREQGPHDDRDQSRIDNFEQGKVNGTYLARIILQELVNRDVLPAGNFLIRSSW